MSIETVPVSTEAIDESIPDLRISQSTYILRGLHDNKQGPNKISSLFAFKTSCFYMHLREKFKSGMA